MSDQGFSKVSPDQSERKAGEAPLLGRVHRTPESGVASRQGVGRRRARTKKSNRVVKAWSILLAAVAIMVLIFAITHAIKDQVSKRGGGTNSTAQFTNLADSFTGTGESELPTLGEERALEIVASALASSDPLEFGDYFVPPKTGTSSEAIEDLESLTSTEGPVQMMRWLGAKYANKQAFEEVVVVREKDGKTSNRLAQLLPRSGNNWLIDFDSFMRTSSSDWKYILDGKVPTAKVRVFLAADSYYNGIFSDEQKWQAFTLTSPDAPKSLYAYAIRGTAQHKALISILSSDGDFHRATLEIRKLPDAGERQFEVSRVLAENWFVSEQPFDASF